MVSGYLLVCTTCIHQSGHHYPECFGNLLLSCFDVYGSQIGSTESENPVWTYENRCRSMWPPAYGIFIGCCGPGVHVWPYMCRNQRPYGTAIGWPTWADTGVYRSIHVSHVKLPHGDCHKRQNHCSSLGECQKYQNSRDNGVPTEVTIENSINYQ